MNTVLVSKRSKIRKKQGVWRLGWPGLVIIFMILLTAVKTSLFGSEKINGPLIGAILEKGGEDEAKNSMNTIERTKDVDRGINRQNRLEDGREEAREHTSQHQYQKAINLAPKISNEDTKVGKRFFEAANPLRDEPQQSCLQYACLSCPESPSECEKCARPYYLDKEAFCNRCSSGCVRCQSSKTCLECSSTHALTSKKKCSLKTWIYIAIFFSIAILALVVGILIFVYDRKMRRREEEVKASVMKRKEELLDMMKKLSEKREKESRGIQSEAGANKRKDLYNKYKYNSLQHSLSRGSSQDNFMNKSRVKMSGGKLSEYRARIRLSKQLSLNNGGMSRDEGSSYEKLDYSTRRSGVEGFNESDRGSERSGRGPESGQSRVRLEDLKNDEEEFSLRSLDESVGRWNQGGYMKTVDTGKDSLKMSLRENGG